MSIHYAPGPDFAVVRPGLVVLVDASVGTPVMADLWAAVVAADGSAQGAAARLATLLDAVTGVLDPTWRSLPGFAVAIVDGTAERCAVQVAVRGACAAAVTTSEGTEHVSGPHVMTWVDKKVHDVVHLELTSGTGTDTPPLLTISDGIVQVERLVWDMRVGAGGLEGAERSAVNGPDEQRLAEEREADRGAAAVADTVVSATAGSDHGLCPVQLAESDFARTLAGVPEEWDEESSEPAAPAGVRADQDGYGELDGFAGLDGFASQDRSINVETDSATAGDGSIADHASPDHASPDHVAVDHDLDFNDSTLFVGAMLDIKTSMLLPEPSGAPEVSSAPHVGYAAGTTPLPPPPPPPPAPSDVSAPSAQSTLSDSMLPYVQASTPPHLQAPLPGDPREPRPVEPFRELAPHGTEVLARSCFFGHPNPPVRMACAQCGGGLSPHAELVTRPSLGRVEVSTGESVDLSVTIIVGRFPQAQTTGSPVAQRLVTVPSPSQDISRSHLEIRLDGWHVLLVDLDTVNGTSLLRAGQPPRRLRPLEPTLVAEGDVVDLGDGITLSFCDLA